ncbi:leptin receptor gene-related protein-like [Syngnathus acus]|uniref:leptin receptor gene-related protein-like n=1 Tax=Syngnathus acus TaxID=161584 RepID=UPI001886009D|nr:leptin receptor gene-related protein-like [Syngnathus acus]
MAGIKELVGLSFGCAIGLTFLFLGCAVQEYGVYYPMFALFLYILSPVPLILVNRVSDESEPANACRDLAYFLTTGIVMSAYGFHLVLAHSGTVEWRACSLALTGDTIIFFTILGFYKVFGSGEDFNWEQW